MSMEIDYEELKKGGYIVQRDPEYFTVRARVPAGLITSKQLVKLAEMAEIYGQGMVHVTSRQGIQIPYIKFESLKAVAKELTDLNIPPGSCGPRVRNVMSCAGLECQNAIFDSQKIGKKIDEGFFGMELPSKFKIAATGCPNSCGKPQLNDIGVMGVVKPKVILEKCDGCGTCTNICKEKAIEIINDKAVVDYNKCVYCGLCILICPIDAKVAELQGYTIFVGGNVGRHPRFGYKLIEFADETTVFNTIENAIKLFAAEAKPEERFRRMIDRIGFERFKKEVLR